MRPTFVALIVLHLLCDLAWPAAGAFRFNPSESVDAVVEQGVQAYAPERAPHAPPPAGEATRFKAASDSFHRPRATTRIATVLPRRDASATDAPSRSTEDH